MAGGTRRRQAQRRRNKDICIKAFLQLHHHRLSSYWVGNYFCIFCIESKNVMVDGTGLDKPKVDKLEVDETAVDEPGPHQNMPLI